ncbi:MAG: PIN domain-containing protein [Candidatus Bathyarchaeota archaeon]|nr:PIN domain-containing protein [Candidatus Bathyarchaeota archaeon]
MQERNSVYSDGVIDVSIIVPACFDNPLKDASIEFLSETLLGKRNTAIPLSAIVGAYHITTRYLKASRIAVRRVLEGVLATKSNALYGDLSINNVSDALDYSTVYNIESWDGVLIALCRSHGSRIIYTMDKEIGKVREIEAVNPFTDNQVIEYHKYIRENIRE